MNDFTRLSATSIAARVSRRETRALDVAEDTLRRIAAYEAVQPEVWISRAPEAGVLAQAARIDARVASGEVLPLAGVPFAVKDNIDVAGILTTAGCPAFGFVPASNATVVQRLIDAGALFVGKTNLDQFATGLVGSRSPYGACANVYNRDYISGGSSSGSAVAVAAGLAAFALGTDTAGSGRVPAAFNHLIGFKPTKGRWSTTGVTPACRSLDCVSVFTSTGADAALIDSVAAGFDPQDPYSRPQPDGPPAPPGALRIAVPRPDQLEFLSDAQSARLYAEAKARAASLGELVECDIAPLLEAASLLYAGPWVAERTAAIGALLRDNPAAIHPVVRGILQGGLAYSAVDAFRGEYAIRAHQRQAEALWRAADVLLLPTAPTAYRVREVLAEPLALNANLGRYTNFVNLLDMSAVAAPAGFRDNGTGFGVSLIGPAFADSRLLDLARLFEAAAPRPAPPPLDLSGRRPAVRLAVVGAHLAAMPLHWQLSSRGARLARQCRTSAEYNLYAMAGATPPKPALVHVGAGGAPIEVEVYELDPADFGSFVAEVPPPLAIGTVTLDDGSQVKGFVAEPRALEGARDITHLGGWRAYVDEADKT